MHTNDSHLSGMEEHKKRKQLQKMGRDVDSEPSDVKQQLIDCK